PELIEESRESTATIYHGSLLRWERFTNNPPVATIDSGLLDEFKRDALKECKPATFNRDWRNIRAILRRIGPQHERNPRGLGFLERIPWVKMARVDLDFPRIATFEELDALYEACDFATWPVSVVPPPEFWRTLIVIAYNVGARRSDIFGLRTRDIHFDR